MPQACAGTVPVVFDDAIGCVVPITVNPHLGVQALPRRRLALQHVKALALPMQELRISQHDFETMENFASPLKDEASGNAGRCQNSKP